MKVEIGPVPGASVIAWISYGREVCAYFADQHQPSFPLELLERFEGLLDEWAAIAVPGELFSWVGDESREEVEFLMKALYEVGLAVEAEHAAGRMGLRPEDADEFHLLVVRQVLGEIAREDPTSAQFVEGLRGEWGIAGRE